MRINKRVAGVAAGVSLLLVSLGTGWVFAQGPTPTVTPSEEAGDDVQSPSYNGSTPVDEDQHEGMSEADEAAALQGLATISSADAEAAALGANPGTSVVETELENENGVLVYSVELSNGTEVKVDAGDGQVLETEQGDGDIESGDQDGVQEEYGSEADDASETAHPED